MGVSITTQWTAAFDDDFHEITTTQKPGESEKAHEDRHVAYMRALWATQLFRPKVGSEINTFRTINQVAESPVVVSVTSDVDESIDLWEDECEARWA